jgi:hypothetical protein
VMLCLALFPSVRLEAVGCGGLLNLVPQARVWIEPVNGPRQEVPYKVFVHPMEGSLVLVREGTPVVLALDKNKKHAVELVLDDLKLSPDGTIIDVPEKTPYKVLLNAPHFNRTYASLRLNDNSLLTVSVVR